VALVDDSPDDQGALAVVVVLGTAEWRDGLVLVALLVVFLWLVIQCFVDQLVVQWQVLQGQVLPREYRFLVARK